MRFTSIFITMCLLFGVTTHAAAFTEPTMADYTSYPILTADAVQPNIMVILDNSGSMNSRAYSDDYTGGPYGSISSYPIQSIGDDLEERTIGGVAADNQHQDLDLGESVVGLRFTGVNIANKAEIEFAFIQFTCIWEDAGVTDLLIEGQASDNADPFDPLDLDNIKNFPATTETVNWDNLPAWTANETYQTPPLTAMVQEIVDRDGWASGNAMAFRLSGTGERDAVSRDHDSTQQPVLNIVSPNQSKRYYGYFNPDYFYNYSGGQFNPTYKKVDYDYPGASWNVEDLLGATASLNNATIEANGLWDGNWLNWLAMRRVDALRKVLMGGKATTRDGDGDQVNIGEDPNGWSYWKLFDSGTSGPSVSPYSGSRWFEVRDGYFRENDTGDQYNIRVLKTDSVDPEDFLEGNLSGVMQRVGDKARWGNIWFNTGTGSGRSGGYVETYVGTDITTIATGDLSAVPPIIGMQDTPATTWTPLAETFYVAMQYFKQEQVAGGLDYPAGTVPISDTDDPFYNNDSGEFVPCAKSFVILLTDGASTMDSKIPLAYRDYDGDGDNTGCDEASNNCDYGSGTDYLDDLALFARTQDLRGDLDGDQNIMLYTIYAFDDNPDARSLLRDAARAGGFEDRNGNGLPDGDYGDPDADRLEWDRNSDGEPDTYFEASDGYALQARMLSAITDIMQRAGSGTAVSVLATNAKGAGSSLQAYFRPMVIDGIEEAKWLGFLQTLWVDPWGNLREDTDHDLRLDVFNSSEQNSAADVDRIVEFFTDADDAKVRLYSSHYLYNPKNGEAENCTLPQAQCNPEHDVVKMEEIETLFEAGERLANRDLDANDRRIFTFIDRNQDGDVGENSIDGIGEVILFDSGTAEELKPYLGVRDGGYWGDLGSSHDDRTTNLINWVRGVDKVGMRNRTLDGVTWRLGDIVNSTPLVVAGPAEKFHLLYSDSDYEDFLTYAADRETMIYVGANDGMLHAFTNWLYFEDLDDPALVSGTPTYRQPNTAGPNEKIGDELWAYIPQSLLPHLKWSALPDYTHTYYVDSEVRVFDAKILPNDTYYNDATGDKNYGTFLVLALNMGGKSITVNEDFTGALEERTFYPSYSLLDITDPREPKLMWEKTYSNLGFAMSVPAPVKVGDEWYLVFGSGATDYDGESNQNSHFYVVDMATGVPQANVPGSDWMWRSAENNGYMNSPVALDIFTNNNVDGIYIADNYVDAAGDRQAEVHKFAVPCSDCPWDDPPPEPAVYDSDPDKWIESTFATVPSHVTVKLAASLDTLDNVLLVFGTGRYISPADQLDNSQQYLINMKDPFYNKAKYEGSKYHNFGAEANLAIGDLFESDGVEATITPTSDGQVFTADGSSYAFDDFAKKIRVDEDGWVLPLLTFGNDPSERIISEVSILGGIVLVPTYVPSQDVCAQDGRTTFVGVHVETGTGYKHQVFDISTLRYRSVTGDGGTPQDQEIVEIRSDKFVLGGPPPKIPAHAGSEKGVRVKLPEDLTINPAYYMQPMYTEMWDNPDYTLTPPVCTDWEHQ